MKKSNKGCAERRQQKRYGPGVKDLYFSYSANHPQQKASSFSFDFKAGEKEKFFRNGGKPVYSPLNWSINDQSDQT